MNVCPEDKGGTAFGPPTTCPICGELLFGMTGVREMDQRPRPGALAICWSCATVLQLGDGLVPSLPDPEWLREMLLADPEAARAIEAAVRAVRDDMLAAHKPGCRDS